MNYENQNGFNSKVLLNCWIVKKKSEYDIAKELNIRIFTVRHKFR